jgi:hypothetical protein
MKISNATRIFVFLKKREKEFFTEGNTRGNVKWNMSSIPRPNKPPPAPSKL